MVEQKQRGILLTSNSPASLCMPFFGCEAVDGVNSFISLLHRDLSC